MQHINSQKKLNDKKQICVGNRLELNEPLFYEYEGKAPNMKFTQIEKLAGYKSRREQVIKKIFLQKH